MRDQEWRKRILSGACFGAWFQAFTANSQVIHSVTLGVFLQERFYELLALLVRDRQFGSVGHHAFPLCPVHKQSFPGRSREPIFSVFAPYRICFAFMTRLLSPCLSA